MENNRPYNELEVVNIRLVKEPSIISEKPIGSPNDAVELIGQFMSQFDREVVCPNPMADNVIITKPSEQCI